MRRILVVSLMLLMVVSSFTFAVSATDEITLESISTDVTVVTPDHTGGAIVQCGPWVPVGDD